MFIQLKLSRIKLMVSLCTLMLLTGNKLIAQFSIPIQPFAELVAGRTLAVRLASLTDKEKKKLKPAELREKQKSLDEHNELLKTLIPKYWVLNGNVEFKTRSEIMTIIKEKDERYVILTSQWGKETVPGSGVYFTFTGYALILFLPEQGKDAIERYQFDDNANGSSAKLKRGTYLAKVTMPDYYMNDRDVRFACIQIRDLVEQGMTDGFTSKIQKVSFKYYKIPEAVTTRLSEKTLLIPKEFLTIDEAEIGTIYKGKYEVISYQDVDTRLKDENSKNYAYYSIVWSEKLAYWTMAIVDNDDCSILMYNPTFQREYKMKPFVGVVPSVFVGVFQTPDGAFVINEAHLEKMNRGIE